VITLSFVPRRNMPAVGVIGVNGFHIMEIYMQVLYLKALNVIRGYPMLSRLP
jgi:hypothetical protein